MRGRIPLGNAVRGFRRLQRPCAGGYGRRAIQISATPTTESPLLTGDVLSNSIDASADSADARFEVLGAPYSLLSVSLSASQKLYTRRGTLVGVSGKAENAQSTLSILEPFRRAALGIPFLYQRISSTSPITALISTKSPLTSFTVLHLNGTVDWIVAQRKALLAWTGHTLSVSPTVNRGMSLAHWGNSEITGRGLVALAGPGQIYQITLKAGEEYVAHPGNVVAYTITQHPPLPYRLKSSSLRFQIPSLGLGYLVPDIKFFRVMKETATWKGLTNLLFNIRTSARRTIWGDRLFLKFHGPTTILLSSRASRISDVLTSKDINEIADTPAGVVQSAVTLARKPQEAKESTKQFTDVPTGFHYVEVSRDGKVKFEDAQEVPPKTR
ncbi:mitochondrial protein-like protein Fmp26 [Rhexocercosporidium sp. MPI-PUGE-AT-0058]|nr:mitochondrial protein-like protein Fmp26 [Rhexocercosporidium sp. MPI-PUGE-AT-0058]